MFFCSARLDFERAVFSGALRLRFGIFLSAAIFLYRQEN
jgi:hypothetical protein